MLARIGRLDFPDFAPGEPVSGSIGIAALEGGVADTAEELVRRVDRALYVAKAAGKRRVHDASDGAVG